MSDHKTTPEENLEKLYAEIEQNAVHAQKAAAGAEEKKSPADREKTGREQPELLRFFGGLLLFGAGMVMIFQNLSVQSTWGYGSIFHFGGLGIPNGTLMIPLLIGIALLFLCERKLWGWLLIAVGIVIILAAVILSVSIHWRTSNGWVFFIMFALTVSGGAMMLRELFRGSK
jgi:hypothetical protein